MHLVENSDECFGHVMYDKKKASFENVSFVSISILSIWDFICFYQMKDSFTRRSSKQILK